MKQLVLIYPRPICLLIILAFPLLAINAFAQDGKVLVHVVDEEKKPLSGVTVFSEDFQFNAITDEKGQLDLAKLSPETTLHLSYLGYKTKHLTLSDIYQTNAIVVLEQEEKILLPVFVVGRRDDRAAYIPYSVENISQDEIKFTQAQHAADALANNANVFVQKSQMGGGSPIIRGFEANRVLLVVDGVRMNNAIYRSGHLQNAITIDNSILQQIEVINGPGSLTYGSDALGGVVHFRTKDPQLNIQQRKDGKKTISKVNYFGRYASVNQEKSSHLDFNIGGKKWATLTSISYGNFGDLRAGNIRKDAYPNFGKRFQYIERINNQDQLVSNDDPNLQRNTGYHQIDFMQKLRFQPSEKLYFIANFQHSNSSNIPRYDQLTVPKGNSFKFAEWYYGPQTRNLVSLRTRLLGKTKIYDHATIIAAYQHIAEDRFQRKTASNWLESSLVNVGVYSFTADFDKALGESHAHNLSYGVDFSHNDITATAFQTDIVENTEEFSVNSRYPSAGSNMSNAGAYFNYRWINPSERLIYNGGLRYTYSQLFGQFSSTDPIQWPSHFLEGIKTNNNALTWATGITYNSYNQWQIRLLSATAFRAPNIDDFAKFREKNGFVLTPNSDLRPEEAFTTELTVAKAFGQLHDTQSGKTGTMLKLSATVFYTRLKHSIVRENATLPNGDNFFVSNGDTLFVQANVNANRAYIYGISTNLLLNFSDRIKLKSSLNYTRGRRVFNDPQQGIYNLLVPQDHIPPLYGQTSLVYEEGRVKLSLFVRYQGRKAVEDYAVSDVINDPLLGYIYDREGSSDNIENGLMDSFGNYQGTYAWTTFNFYGAYKLTDKLSLSIGLENIADLHYRNFASGLSAPGRNLILSLRGSF
jgi:hemoglobin/transferrin/lactoferrin receptor protein